MALCVFILWSHYIFILWSYCSGYNIYPLPLVKKTNLLYALEETITGKSYKTLQRKLKIEQHESHLKQGMNSGTPEVLSVPVC